MSNGRAEGAPEGSQTARAEDLVDDVSDRLDDWSDKVADWVALGLARAREEIEDIWADAQSIRRGQ